MIRRPQTAIIKVISLVSVTRMKFCRDIYVKERLFIHLSSLLLSTVIKDSEKSNLGSI